MLMRRQKIAVACAALFVVLAVALAVVKFSDGAWVQGTVWIVAAACFAIGQSISLTRSRGA
jgi:hypothetical protein